MGWWGFAKREQYIPEVSENPQAGDAFGPQE